MVLRWVEKTADRTAVTSAERMVVVMVDKWAVLKGRQLVV